MKKMEVQETTVTSTSATTHATAPTNVVVIRGFVGKSKTGAVSAVQSIVAGCLGSPEVVVDETANVPGPVNV